MVCKILSGPACAPVSLLISHSPLSAILTAPHLGHRSAGFLLFRFSGLAQAAFSAALLDTLLLALQSSAGHHRLQEGSVFLSVFVWLLQPIITNLVFLNDADL